MPARYPSYLPGLVSNMFASTSSQQPRTVSLSWFCHSPPGVGTRLCNIMSDLEGQTQSQASPRELCCSILRSPVSEPPSRPHSSTSATVSFPHIVSHSDSIVRTYWDCASQIFAYKPLMPSCSTMIRPFWQPSPTHTGNREHGSIWEARKGGTWGLPIFLHLNQEGGSLSSTSSLESQNQ